MWVLSRFQSLTTLTLYSNKLPGKLPDSWGSSGAFPKLRTLTLSKNDISGAAQATLSALGADCCECSRKCCGRYAGLGSTHKLLHIAFNTSHCSWAARQFFVSRVQVRQLSAGLEQLLRWHMPHAAVAAIKSS